LEYWGSPPWDDGSFPVQKSEQSNGYVQPGFVAGSGPSCRRRNELGKHRYRIAKKREEEMKRENRLGKAEQWMLRGE